MRRAVVFFDRRWPQVQNLAPTLADPLVTDARQNAHFLRVEKFKRDKTQNIKYKSLAQNKVLSGLDF